jgi:hypothetical protein
MRCASGSACSIFPEPGNRGGGVDRLVEAHDRGKGFQIDHTVDVDPPPAGVARHLDHFTALDPTVGKARIVLRVHRIHEVDPIVLAAVFLTFLVVLKVRHQPHPGGELSPVAKLSGIADRGGQRPDDFDLDQPLRRLSPARQFGHAPVVVGDTLIAASQPRAHRGHPLGHDQAVLA